MTVNLNQPTLALLVDCWHDTSDPLIEETWHRIADLCYNNNYIQAVAVTSYWGYNYDACQESPWYEQSDLLFNQTTKWDYLRSDWKRFNFRDPLKDNRINHTSPIVRDMKVRDDQLQLNIYNGLQMIYFCNYVNPAIRNILLMGRAWDMCLKFRSVGWLELGYIIQYNMFKNSMNLFTRRNCVLTPEIQHPQIQSPWVQIDDQHYWFDPAQNSINS